MCILNGRNSVCNDYTCITSLGYSVVDYCLVNHDELVLYSDFKVSKVTELINQIGHDCILFSSAFPDHSVLSWKIDISGISCRENHADVSVTDKTEPLLKFDARKITSDFMSNVNLCRQLHTAVFELESSLISQHDLDNTYNTLCSLIKEEMIDKLPMKRLTFFDGNDNKKRRIRKPWWNDNLTELWNEMCKHENIWLSCKIGAQKHILKRNYLQKRKLFDKMVQRAKRIYWFNVQKEILNEVAHDQNEFWKTIGRVGIGTKRNILMEVVLEDGSVSRNSKDVLSKWKDSFETLYNSNSSTDIPIDMATEPMQDVGEPLFDNMLSVSEVKEAIANAKCNNACGIDGIPTEVFKNDTAVSFLHILFNTCFTTGNIPSDWGRGIINPIPKSSTTDPRDPLSYRGITLAPSMYKLYCFILNKRLSSWSEGNNKIEDEQNGFRKNRSTVEQISSLTSII